jgi:hypothetical protein
MEVWWGARHVHATGVWVILGSCLGLHSVYRFKNGTVFEQLWINSSRFHCHEYILRCNECIIATYGTERLEFQISGRSSSIKYFTTTPSSSISMALDGWQCTTTFLISSKFSTSCCEWKHYQEVVHFLASAWVFTPRVPFCAVMRCAEK